MYNGCNEEIGDRMKLKRIEAIGFKSFADKTIIEFGDGITAIVGPNGSGKSNISDAVKWVLGEQSSKSLRGDRMADVIFNGTTKRPPLNVAEVTIVLDNSDGTLPVDYDEVSITRRIFRSGESQYLINKQTVRLKDVRDLIADTGIGADSLSIISQDKVRSVVEVGNEGRRSIIEEAAGVLKYKMRKKETVRNLEHTETNLERARDILIELESQYNRLKKQASIAEKYLELKKELESIEIALCVQDIEVALKNIKDLEQKINEYSIQVINYEAMKAKNSEKIQTLTGLKADYEKQINRFQEELMDINSKISFIDGKRRALIGQSEEGDYEVILIETINDVRNKQSELRRLEETTQEKEERLDFLKKELTVKRNHYFQKQSQYQTLKAKTDWLNDFSNSYYSGVREVIIGKEHGFLSGIHGTVELLISTDETYIEAIETTLQAAMQHIVVDNVPSAQQAIDYLKRGNRGRATFLPMDVMRPRFIDSNSYNVIRHLNGFIDVAVNLVNYDSKFDSVMKNLLGNVIVCDNLDHATAIARAINHRYRIVTLDGEVIHVGGSMTGGRQQKKTPSLLQQRQQLEDAQKEIEQLEKQLPHLQGTIQRIEEEIELLESTLYHDQVEVMRLREVIRAKQSTINQLKVNEEEDEVKRLVETRQQLTSKLQDLRLKNVENTEAIEHLERENREIDKFVRNATNEIHDLDVEKNRLDVRCNNLLDFLQNEYQMTFDHAKANYRLTVDYEVAKIKVRTLRRHIEQLGHVNLAAIEEFEEVATRYEQLQANYDDLMQAKENILTSISELDEVMIERFKETFDRVNTEFGIVFRQLFRGGHAELVLEDESDLLNTGVEIVAQPPGTKLNNVNLLSGGQKTLTAISLLFAILRVRTIPFVILDECEAALDEANVVRYADYLKEYSDQTQFIVITHRKGTMEKADYLYGITMQEQGVTTVVSVRFEEAQELVGEEKVEQVV